MIISSRCLRDRAVEDKIKEKAVCMAACMYSDVTSMCYCGVKKVYVVVNVSET